MIRGNELQQQYSQAETAIHEAAQRCESTGSVPMEVKDSIQKLEQEAGTARDAILSQDESRIRQKIDELEELGDRAKSACESGGQVDEALKDAIMQAHQRLSDLKRKLH
jgi:DNA-binding ferritin-like protein